MNKFLLMTAGGSMPETEEEQGVVMKAWTDWFEELGDHLVDGPNMIRPGARTVDRDGTITYGHNGTEVNGYILLQAESLDHAVTLAAGFPKRDDGNITVYEVVSSM